MKFKEDVDVQYVNDPYYDLFEGGYLKPEELLEEEDAEKVKEAVKVIETFIREAESAGLIEFA